jgi:large subunit ribosomal protein L10
MVSEKKIQTVKEVKELIKKYPVVGVLDMHKTGGRQLHEIRESLRGKAVIKTVKKNLIKIIFKDAGIDMESCIRNEPALLLSAESPFRVARLIDANKSVGSAKPGDVAKKDIVIKPGPTPLGPGPAIGELQKVGLIVGVEGGKIAVKREKVVAKAGDVITPEVASVLGKLNIQPMEISLNLVAAWEKGMVYKKDVLFVPMEEYIGNIKAAYRNALSLSLKTGFYTKENIKMFVGKAWREMKALSGRVKGPEQT